MTAKEKKILILEVHRKNIVEAKDFEAFKIVQLEYINLVIDLIRLEDV